MSVPSSDRAAEAREQAVRLIEANLPVSSGSDQVDRWNAVRIADALMSWVAERERAAEQRGAGRERERFARNSLNAREVRARFEPECDCGHDPDEHREDEGCVHGWTLSENGCWYSNWSDGCECEASPAALARGSSEPKP